MNPSQQAVADLIRISTTKKFPGNQIVSDLEANPDLWNSFYATLHSYAMPGSYSVYDFDAMSIAAKSLDEIYQGKLEYNKLIVFTTIRDNNKLEHLAKKNWDCKSHHYTSGLLRHENNHIRILIFHWY